VVKLNGVKCRRMPDLHHELLPDIVADSLQAMKRRIDDLSAQVEALQRQADNASQTEAMGEADVEGEIETDEEPVRVVETTPA
jgi:hypothetical protein